MADLLVIVPTRARPGLLAPIVKSWTATEAWPDARLTFVVDTDDPTFDDYQREFREVDLPPAAKGRLRIVGANKWRPLVPKLNLAAVTWAPEHHALAFMGDDHRPRTKRWALLMLAALREMGTGIVYGNDLLQGERLCTSWAMTSDIVQALGRMVPAPVEHMYCDNSVMDLGRQAGCLRYLPHVVVEHCHPLAGKAEWDVGYARVNRAEQYQRDAAAYNRWADSDRDADVAAVQAVRGRRGSVRDA